MARSLDNLRNAILCDDIREEVGNKLSLMGVFGGDILVTSFPAQIQLAVFIQYIPSADEEDGPLVLEIELLQNDTRMINGKIEATIINRQNANVTIPKAIGIFERECTFRVVASLDGAKKEIMAKKIRKTELLKSNPS